MTSLMIPFSDVIIAYAQEPTDRWWMNSSVCNIRRNVVADYCESAGDRVRHSVVRNHVSAVVWAVTRASAFAINLNALDQWQMDDNHNSPVTIYRM